MLVLSRQKDESIMIGDDIEVMVTLIAEDRVKIGTIAPRNVPVHRREVWDRIQKEGSIRDAYTVDPTHTDPGEQETALALAEKKLKRAEGLLAVAEKALKVYRDRDKQLEDVFLPDKGGE